MVLDIAFIIVLVLSVLHGRKKGLFGALRPLVSLIMSAIGTSIFAEGLMEWFSGTSFYHSQFDKLVLGIIEKAEIKGVPLEAVAEEAEKIAQSTAQNILGTLVTCLCFIALYIVFNIILRFLDKILLHVPIARPLNRILGMFFSFVFTFVILYVAIGALGGFATYASSDFIRTQMESSYVVRLIYENNVIQYLF